MLKIKLLVISVLLTIGTAYAQVEDIRKKSEEKSEEKNNENSGSEYRSSENMGSTPGDGCASMACGMCFDMVGSVVVSVLMEHHYELKANRDKNPLPFSLQIRPMMAYSPDNGIVNMLPQITGNLGVLSTDFRVNYLIDFEDFSAISYGAYEWQILVLNLIPTPEIGFHLGGGVYFDRHSGLSYPEFSTAIDLNLMDNKLLNQVSGRLAFDDSSVASFYEVSARSAYKFVDFKHLYAHVDLGLSYKNYYETAGMFFVNTGLLFTIF